MKNSNKEGEYYEGNLNNGLWVSVKNLCSSIMNGLYLV